MSHSAPWQLEGFNPQPGGQVKMFDPTQFNMGTTNVPAADQANSQKQTPPDGVAANGSVSYEQSSWDWNQSWGDFNNDSQQVDYGLQTPYNAQVANNNVWQQNPTSAQGQMYPGQNDQNYSQVQTEFQGQNGTAESYQYNQQGTWDPNVWNQTQYQDNSWQSAGQVQAWPNNTQTDGYNAPQHAQGGQFNQMPNQQQYQYPGGNMSQIQPAVSAAQTSNSSAATYDDGAMSHFFHSDDPPMSDLEQSHGSTASGQMAPADKGTDGAAAPMEEIPLDSPQRPFIAAAAKEEPKLSPASNSFSKLSHEPSPFDALGTNSQQVPTMLSSQNSSTPSHSRDNSFGSKVKFIVGSEPTSANQSASQSPHTIGDQRSDASGSPHVEGNAPQGGSAVPQQHRQLQARHGEHQPPQAQHREQPVLQGHFTEQQPQYQPSAGQYLQAQQPVDQAQLQQQSLTADQAQLQQQGRTADQAQLQQQGLRVDQAQLQQQGLRVDQAQLQQQGLTVDQAQLQQQGLTEQAAQHQPVPQQMLQSDLEGSGAHGAQLNQTMQPGFDPSNTAGQMYTGAVGQIHPGQVYGVPPAGGQAWGGADTGMAHGTEPFSGQLPADRPPPVERQTSRSSQSSETMKESPNRPASVQSNPNRPASVQSSVSSDSIPQPLSYSQGSEYRGVSSPPRTPQQHTTSPPAHQHITPTTHVHSSAQGPSQNFSMEHGVPSPTSPGVRAGPTYIYQNGQPDTVTGNDMGPHSDFPPPTHQGNMRSPPLPTKLPEMPPPSGSSGEHSLPGQSVSMGGPLSPTGSHQQPVHSGQGLDVAPLPGTPQAQHMPPEGVLQGYGTQGICTPSGNTLHEQGGQQGLPASAGVSPPQVTEHNMPNAHSATTRPGTLPQGLPEGHGMPQGLPPGHDVPQGLSQRQSQGHGVPQGLPQGQPQGHGVPQGLPQGHGVPQRLPQGPPQGHGVPQGLPQGHGAPQGQPQGQSQEYGVPQGLPPGYGVPQGPAPQGPHGDSALQLNIYATPIQSSPDSPFQPPQKSFHPIQQAPSQPTSYTEGPHDFTASPRGAAQVMHDQRQLNPAIVSPQLNVNVSEKEPPSQQMPSRSGENVSSKTVTPETSLSPGAQKHHPMVYELQAYRDEHNMTPATTLWENPEPKVPGICLAPAATNVETSPVTSPPRRQLAGTPAQPVVPLNVSHIQQHVQEELQQMKVPSSIETGTEQGKQSAVGNVPSGPDSVASAGAPTISQGQQATPAAGSNANSGGNIPNPGPSQSYPVQNNQGAYSDKTYPDRTVTNSDNSHSYTGENVPKQAQSGDPGHTTQSQPGEQNQADRRDRSYGDPHYRGKSYERQESESSHRSVQSVDSQQGRRSSRDYPPDPRYDRHYDPYANYRDHYRDPYYDRYYEERGWGRPSSRGPYADYDSYRDPYRYERYERPRSRQDERPPSRHGETAEQHRPHSRTDYDRYRDYYHSRDRYSRDYDYYYGNRGYYDQDYYAAYYQRQDRFSRGYEEEMQSYGQVAKTGQQTGYADTYGYHGYGRSSSYDDYDRRSSYSHSRSSSRANTPGPELYGGDAAEQFAQEFHQGSRPNSRQSGYEQSPIYGNRSVHVDPYSQAYHQGYDYYGQAHATYDYSYQDYGQTAEPEVEAKPGRRTPPKYTIPHVRASFGPDGKMVKVLPNGPGEGHTAAVELHDVAALLPETRESEELRRFPGPLIKGETHKKDVLMFCQKMARECRENVTLIDRESAELIWKLLELLIKQNGMVVGTDIAELLLEGHEPSTADYSQQGMKIAGSCDNLTGDTTTEDDTPASVGTDRTSINKKSSQSMEEVTDRFRSLLLYGRKKDALEWSVKHNLWGHALFLASKMDPKTHATIMTRFANISMRMNDPLQTLYQMMSGRQPAAVTLVSDDKWGDWRPHLAMILSNHTNRPELDMKSIVTLGATLASKGCLYSSHFCYLMAQLELGEYNKKSSKMALIGSSHSLPFEEFANNVAIQCTEVYEYAQSLGNPLFTLPHFQIYKLLYASRLAEAGLPEEALHYCEVVASTVNQNPEFYNASLARVAYDLGNKLKYHDPQRLQGEDDMEDPYWLQQILRVCQAFDDGTIQHMIPGSGSETPAGIGSTATGSEAGDMANVGQVTEANLYQHQEQYSQQNTQLSYDAQQYDPNSQFYGQDGQDYSSYYQQNPQTWAQPGQDGSYMDYAQQIQGGTTQQPGGQQDQSYQQQYMNGQYNQYGTAQYNAEEGQYSADPSQQYNVDQYGQPIDGATAVENTAYAGQGTYTQQADSTQAPQGEVNLGASMNSGYTSTTGNSDNTDVVDAGTESKRSSFDYYAMSSKEASKIQSPKKKKVVKIVQKPDTISEEKAEPMSDAVQERESEETVQDQDQLTEMLGMKASSPPRSPDSQHTSSPRAAMSPKRPARSRTSSNNSGIFSFGVPPPPSCTYRPSGPSVPLGAANSFKPESPVSKEPPQTKEPADAKDKPKSKAKKQTKGGGSGWFGGIFSKFVPRGKNEMILPDDKNPTIIWDEKTKRWINTDEDEDEVAKNSAPPPKDSDLGGKPTVTAAATTPSVGGPPIGGNKFSLQKTRGARGQYVDVVNASGMSKPSSAAPANLFSVLPKSASVPANIFIPSVTEHASQDQSQAGNLLGQTNAESSDKTEPEANTGQQEQPSMQFYNPAALHAGDGTQQNALAPDDEHTDKLSESSSKSSLSREIQQYTFQGTTSQPGQETGPPPAPQMMMFDPAQFNQGPAPPAPSSGPGRGLRYGQRRAYPK